MCYHDWLEGHTWHIEHQDGSEWTYDDFLEFVKPDRLSWWPEVHTVLDTDGELLIFANKEADKGYEIWRGSDLADMVVVWDS